MVTGIHKQNWVLCKHCLYTVSENKLLSVVMESVPLSKDAFMPKIRVNQNWPACQSELFSALSHSFILHITLISKPIFFYSPYTSPVCSQSSFQSSTDSKTNLEEFFFPCILMLLATEQKWSIVKYSLISKLGQFTDIISKTHINLCELSRSKAGQQLLF